MAWVNKFSCNNCDYESSSTVLWGRFNYTFEENENSFEQNVEREYGWCYDCEYICPIEIIPTIDSLEAKKEEYIHDYSRAELELIKKENRLIKFESTKKRIDYLRRIIKWYPDEIHGKELLITAVRNRNSKPKCLFCASDNVKYLTVPEVDKYKDETLKNINFQHPNCGGDLRIEDISLSISGISTERYYNLDGCLLYENTSTKDVGIKSWNE